MSLSYRAEQALQEIALQQKRIADSLEELCANNNRS